MTQITDAERLEVQDPSTSAARLAELAYAHQELHAAILLHPAIYDGLAEWISSQTPAPVEPPKAPTVRPSDPQRAAVDARRPLTLAVPVLASMGVVVALVVGCAIAFAAATTSNYSPVYSDGDDFEMLDESAVVESDPETAPAEPLRDPRIVSSCDLLYSASMRSSLEKAGLVLNPAWTSTVTAGTADPTLAGFIENPLVCAWGSPNSNNGTYVITTVSAMNPSSKSTVESRLADYTLVDSPQVGGYRFVIDAQTWGESHLLREGLWFATMWAGFGPDGYTADIVTNTFG